MKFRRLYGKITNFYEWSGAGHLSNDVFMGLVARDEPGPMRDLYFDADQENLYLRLDINRDAIEPGDALVVRILKPFEFNITLGLEQNLLICRPPAPHQSGTKNIPNVRAYVILESAYHRDLISRRP